MGIILGRSLTDALNDGWEDTQRGLWEDPLGEPEDAPQLPTERLPTGEVTILEALYERHDQSLTPRTLAEAIVEWGDDGQPSSSRLSRRGTRVVPARPKPKPKPPSQPSPRAEVIERNRRLKLSGQRWCPRCRQVKALEAFGARDGRPFASHHCTECLREERRIQYQALSPEQKAARKRRIYNYMATTTLNGHGFTLEQAQALLAQQGGRCAICTQELSGIGRGKGTGVVDHDHTTKNVRGILCWTCNYGLGNFRDNLLLLSRAIDYLSSPLPVIP